MAERDYVFRASRREVIGAALAGSLLELSTPRSAYAQTLPSTLDEITSLCSRAIHTIIIPAFKQSQTLSAHDRNVLNGVRWQLEPYNWNLFATRAINDGIPSVLISAGMADTLYVMSYDFILAYSMNLYGEFETFILKVRSSIFENQRLVIQGKAPKPTPRFADYAHISMQDIRRKVPDPSIFNLIIPTTVNGLAFVCGHELAHHVFGDVAPSKQQSTEREIRAQEARADKFSMRLCSSVDLSPMGSYPLFLIYTAFGGDRFHPAPECRILDIFESSLSEFESKPRVTNRDKGLLEADKDLKRFRDSVLTLRRSLSSSCR